MTELQTTASTQNHHPAPKTAPATPGPNMAHSSEKSIRLTPSKLIRILFDKRFVQIREVVNLTFPVAESFFFFLMLSRPKKELTLNNSCIIFLYKKKSNYCTINGNFFFLSESVKTLYTSLIQIYKV